MRIYIVKTNGDGKVVRYVWAASQSAAVRAVITEKYSAVVATPEDIYLASKAGTLDVIGANADVEPNAEIGMQPRPNSRMPVDA